MPTAEPVVYNPSASGLATLLAAFLLAFLAQALSCAALAQDSANLPRQQVEQLVAPIALYPDPLLAQVLMAATYPLEVVEAARWQKANPRVTGNALEQAMQRQSWDPSVKALTAVPATLQMMSEKLDWTQQLGDAVLAQRDDVMSAIQTLRARARTADQLKTTQQQRVVTRGSGATETIIIEPTNPDIVYLPIYDPAVVYGPWPYPDYRPWYWYPPGYVVSNVISFAAGVAVGAAIWGRCDWNRRDIDIDVNRYNRFNRTNIVDNHWEHNAIHRKGVPYANKAVADRFGKGGGEVRSRDDLRARAAGAKDGADRAGQLGKAANDNRASAKAKGDAAKGKAARQARSTGSKVASHKARPTRSRSVDSVARNRQVKISGNRGRVARIGAAGGGRARSIGARGGGGKALGGRRGGRRR